jgi:phosphoglycolate phosphatase
LGWRFGFGPSDLRNWNVTHQIPSLIFDLDGTLTDSKPGILGCLRKVLDARRISYSGPLDHFVGPPVEDWAVELLPNGSDEERAALAREYRASYTREGWNNNSVYEGVAGMLTRLEQAGFPLYVCTSKLEHTAVRILETFGLAQFFTAIYGDRAEYESHSKVDLLGLLLDDLELDKAATWMVGDRIHDIEAAHANGIRCLAAAWGYGTRDEWNLADAVAATPAEALDCFQSSSAPPSLSAKNGAGPA